MKTRKHWEKIKEPAHIPSIVFVTCSHNPKASTRQLPTSVRGFVADQWQVWASSGGVSGVDRIRGESALQADRYPRPRLIHS